MSKRQIALYGSTGKAGNQLIAEALKRKFKVTAIVYDINKVFLKHPNLTVLWGHMMNPEEIENQVKGHDMVIGIHEPLLINLTEHTRSVQSVISGTKHAGVKHLIVVGHPIHKPIENTLEFYNSWKLIKHAQSEALKLFKREGALNWGYIYSPSLNLDNRTGKLSMPEEIPYCTFSEEQNIPAHHYSSALFDIVEERLDTRKMEIYI